MWLFLVSEKIQLKSTETSGGSYETYLNASTTQFLEIRSRCSTFDWPSEANFNHHAESSETSSSDSRPEGDPPASRHYFYEGEFSLPSSPSYETF
ncbi:Hypothetical protein FKW44_020525 [Caligus rogercresseyi]|uniref:Uncharacterized protein n=1 Tax=Caligus rogercresseyi TaxID=217165 RepID=A0A7T8GXF5_CALRO|nr:Hypothetical protein FKW44_020525 [Caligus rogercresseyi]